MKNLEDEYRKSQQEEMSDLWDRIEAALPSKKSGKTRYVNRILGIAAAGIFLALLIPCALYIQRGGSYSSDSTAEYAFDMAAQAGAENGMETGSTGGEGGQVLGDEAEMDELQSGVTAQEEQSDAAFGTESVQESVTQGTLREESMEVAGITQEDGRTVCTLRAEDGGTIKAVLPDTAGAELKVGESYLFFLRPEEGAAWDYRIEKVE